MRVGLATTQKFHFFDVARQLKKLGLLSSLITGYPRSRTLSEGLSSEDLVHFPFYTSLFMATNRITHDTFFQRELEWVANQRMDVFASRTHKDCDVLMTMCGLGLQSGSSVQRRGGRFFVDRPVVHISVQDRILAAAHEQAGVPYLHIDPRKIAKEVEEYGIADRILVPSKIVARTMVSEGIDPGKVCILPLGVDLKLFSPEGEKSVETEVLFAGNVMVQKGIFVLAEAIERLANKNLIVTICGAIVKESAPALARLAKVCRLEVTGKISQDELRRKMTRATMFVLPSIQDGFGVVVPQAIGCGTPCIVSDMAGASEMIEHGKSGLVVPSGRPDALAAAINQLAEDPTLRESLASEGFKSVHRLGGWDAYGSLLADQVLERDDRDGCK